jgi:hypothetical protein
MWRRQVGNSLIYPDSSVARLRCQENGGGIPCWPSRSGWTSRLKRTSPRLRGGDYYTMLAEYPPSVPIRAALLVWENRCDLRSPCALRRQQDEVGVWCASAQLRPGVGAVGDGPTAEAAVTDLRDALEASLAEVGPPDELTLTLDVA